VVFLRQNQESSSEKGAWVSPRVMARFDSYSFSSDEFGNVDKRRDLSYFNLDKAMAHTGGGNEAMISDAVSLLDDIEVLKAYSSTQRNQIIADLKAAGITEIRGLPVEERVVTAGEVSGAIQKAKAVLKATVSGWFAHAEEFVSDAKEAAGTAAAAVKDHLSAYKAAKYLASDAAAPAAEDAVAGMYHKDAAGLAQKLDTAYAGATKKESIKRVAKAMKSSDAEIQALYDAAGLYGSPGYSPRNVAVGALVASWAQSNSSPISLALQYSAAQLFGMPDESLLNPEKYSGSEWTKLVTQHGAVLQDFLLAQWQATQTDLAEHGVQNMTLYRVFHFNGSSTPEWAKNAAAGATIDAPAANPLSSWAFSAKGAQTAATFASGGKTVLVKSVVPAALALSYPRSGFGAYKEDEFVILGAAGQWDIVSVSG
jgi:hypothetical protein